MLTNQNKPSAFTEQIAPTHLEERKESTFKQKAKNISKMSYLTDSGPIHKNQTLQTTADLLAMNAKSRDQLARIEEDLMRQSAKVEDVEANQTASLQVLSNSDMTRTLD